MAEDRLLVTDPKLAKAIVNEAASRKIPIPIEKQAGEAAGKIIEMAQQAYDSGARGEDVMVFIRMIEEDSQETAQEPEKRTEDKRSDRHSFMEKVLMTKRQDIVKRENLAEPPEIEGKPPELPDDVSQKSEEEVRSLHAQFLACFARAGYLLSLAENEAEQCKHVADYYEDATLGEVEAEVEKKLSVTALKARAAEREPKIVEYRQKWQDARSDARELRALKEIYDKCCDRLSREMSMRRKEEESS